MPFTPLLCLLEPTHADIPLSRAMLYGLYVAYRLSYERSAIVKARSQRGAEVMEKWKESADVEDVGREGQGVCQAIEGVGRKGRSRDWGRRYWLTRLVLGVRNVWKGLCRIVVLSVS